MTAATSTTSSRSNLLGPLTTTWSAPSPCQTAWQDCSTCSHAWQGQGCLDSGSNQDTSTCWPPIAETSTTYGAPFVGLGFYSPGLACPAGYATACGVSVASDGLQKTISGQQQFQFQFVPIAGETAAGCCPSGYTCASHNNGQTCSRQLASTTEVLLTCATGASTVLTSVALPHRVTTTASGSIVGISTMTQFVIWAPMFQLNYQATDLPNKTSVLDAGSVTATASSSNTTSSTSSGSSSDHTTTLAVAIAVPVVVVALISAFLGWWFCARKRTRRTNAIRGPYALAATLPEPDYQPMCAPSELSSQNALVEMASPPARPVEMSHEYSVVNPGMQSTTVQESASFLSVRR